VKRVTLFEQEGETSIYIDAEINDEGDIKINGQDVGKAPREFWGDSDYEYSVFVSGKYIDAVRYALLDRLKDEYPEEYAEFLELQSQEDIIISAIKILYSGDPSAVSHFKDYMRSVGIDAEFWSWA
jgi:hypothetical protein